MIVAVSSFQSLGCTFVDWSIHYLSGQNTFYHAKNGLLPVSSNPLTGANAHGHLKNHPRGHKVTVQCIESLKQQQLPLLSFYPVPLTIAEAAVDLGIDMSDTVSEHNFKNIQNYVNQDFEKALNASIDAGCKLIYVDHDHTVSQYFNKRKSRESLIAKIPDGTSYDSTTIKNEYQNFFFKDNIQHWNNLGLNNIWDQREHEALCARPFEVWKFGQGFCKPHLWIDCRELWCNTESVLMNIFKYIELPIDQDRLLTWRNICAQWSAMQLDAWKFDLTYKRIVDSVINNWWMKIDLTFDQEVVIQHCLIYQHNLNLKTWQLEKFPNNTQDLYKLLEPNTHPVPDIY